MLEAAFRFLFKYPPLMFQQGDFTWGLSRPVLLAVVGASTAAGAQITQSAGTGATDELWEFTAQ